MHIKRLCAMVDFASLKKKIGGALKETDTGLWVHLVCALYTPGIAFGELDKLTQVQENIIYANEAYILCNCYA